MKHKTVNSSKKRFNFISIAMFLFCLPAFCSIENGTPAGQAETDSSTSFFSRLSVGGYGEVAFSRMFYSDNVYRYKEPAKYKNDTSHGRFDIPHAVIYLNYDFGKGWRMGSEIEFEHTGTGTSYEKDYEESGEWEQEVEKGGEVELEQMWLQKTFSDAFHIRVGHIVVPFGLTNAHHEPLNFFTVYRSEGESQIFPCTWHQTGISFWGKYKDWRYEFQILPALDAMQFTRDEWVAKGANTPYEFAVANKYGVALRFDNYSISGLRIGLSGYYGHTIDNTYTRENSSEATSRKKKGELLMGAFDFTYDAHYWIVRGNMDYGHLGDATFIYNLTGRQTKTSPYSSSPVAPAAIASGIEVGWDIFSQIQKFRDKQQFYVFGRYEYYDSYIPKKGYTDYNYDAKNRLALGLNYFPISQIVVKAEYSKRFLKSTFNNEPSVSLGIAYQGFFH